MLVSSQEGAALLSLASLPRLDEDMHHSLCQHLIISSVSSSTNQLISIFQGIFQSSGVVINIDENRVSVGRDYQPVILRNIDFSELEDDEAYSLRVS